MDFGWALRMMKDGRKVARKFWNEGYYCYIDDNDILITDEYQVTDFLLLSKDVLVEDWEEI